MKRLSKTQLYRTSEILGNISVAWFSAGAITPLFVTSLTTVDFIVRFGLSLLWFSVFFTLSLKVAKEEK